MTHWKPSASLQNLKARAELLATVRAFFAERKVLEVDTPSLSHHGVTDRYMRSITAEVSSNQRGFLQTSPEYAMKRILAAGSGSIYQICKAFRQDEMGAKHNPEFSMLEWYRVGFNHVQLMDEVYELIEFVLGKRQQERLSYQQVFIKFLGIDPLSINDEELEQFARTNLGLLPDELERDDYLSLLFEDKIEPKLGLNDSACFIYDYPESQAALARISETDLRVAHRFELYIEGIELANGFYELADSQQQLKRFEADNRWRVENNLPEIAIDQHFIEALEHGLPECSGVALGLDRLLMIKLATNNICDVIAFPWDRA
ncbi:elongation factor P--(R)-beta-lysine ligase [Kangiella aquimarina]|uniref:Elongation factor P--(R)-beta-lysine ligase n=1 Tax=Kangiella aquimarina TaxID=261965 RepID=A0ABZ0X6J2_9GAMM|nr:elongation factor P--(R)-beta-lysine ligase [Kangiella aquimarina]WQG86221.1 elongation factor P--(R)-beta-lysine ligase [Kangiella aquimarina]